MDDLLLLTHRIPWPPNKGDKIRSHHLLRYLADRYRVHLATFIDDPADEQHIAALHELCASVHVGRLDPRRARLRALSGLLTGAPLSLPYYRDAELARWVRGVVSEHRIEQALVFSSPMAQYLDGLPSVRRVVDLVDVDSDKWRQYAAVRHQPARWVYAREARRLLAYERSIVAAADAALLVSEEEAALFRQLAPESAAKTVALHNGVDTAFFDPAHRGVSPYPDDALPLVFSGAMDYWPNEQAVSWFARHVLPRVREADPRVSFHIVGSRPSRVVQALSQESGIEVTGFVDDIRPWLGHAAMAVAPLKTARGVQNKVLEAMAMGRPVIGTPEALSGITATVGEDVLQADEPEAFADAISAHLVRPDRRLGERARACVVERYGWEAQLGRLDRLLTGQQTEHPPSVVTDAVAIKEVSHGR